MRIALTGTHSVGKTTLVKELGKLEQFNDYELSFSNTRDLKEKGFDINCDGTNYDLTQELVLTFHLKDLLKPKLLTDRCLVDGLAYTQYLNSKELVSNLTLEMFGQIASTFLRNYEYIFYCPVYDELEDDGVRSTDVDFRMGVDTILQHHLVNQIPNCYTLPSKDIQENINFILQVIKNDSEDASTMSVVR